jgi:hypothetical protein
MAFFPDLKVTYFGLKGLMPVNHAAGTLESSFVDCSFVEGNRYPDHLFQSARLIVYTALRRSEIERHGLRRACLTAAHDTIRTAR